MILGIGVDIMAVSRLSIDNLKENDPFFRRTFSEKEQEEGFRHSLPVRYFASRFAGKEAVFKAFRLHPDQGEFQEIEIMNAKNGAPYVNLYGYMKEIAAEMGNLKLHISLSEEKEYIAAFAVLEADEGGKTYDESN